MIEYILPFVLAFGIHYIRRVVRECLCDEALNTHVFVDLNYSQKSPRERLILIDNASYVLQLALYMLIIFIVPFQSFKYYSFQELYVVLQVWSMCFYSKESKLLEKTIAVTCMLVYLFIMSSMIMDSFVIYSMVSVQPFVEMEHQLFKGRLWSKQTHRVLQMFETMVMIIMWVSGVVRFYANPNYTDAIVIPCIFWVQYNYESQNKKKI